MAKTKSRATARGTNWGRLLTMGVALVLAIWLGAFLANNVWLIVGARLHAFA